MERRRPGSLAPVADVPVDDEARLAGLLERAFTSVPAHEANRAIDEVRGKWGRGGPAYSYEIVLSEGRGWAYLRDSVAPSLVRYLRSKRMHVDACAPVFLSTFSGESLYFVGASDFFAFFCEAESISLDTLRERAREWENVKQ